MGRRTLLVMLAYIATARVKRLRLLNRGIAATRKLGERFFEAELHYASQGIVRPAHGRMATQGGRQAFRRRDRCHQQQQAKSRTSGSHSLARPVARTSAGSRRRELSSHQSRLVHQGLRHMGSPRPGRSSSWMSSAFHAHGLVTDPGGARCEGGREHVARSHYDRTGRRCRHQRPACRPLRPAAFDRGAIPDGSQ